MKLKSRNAMVALILGLTVLPVNAQRDKNYYTQVVRLADGSEVRLLPDNIEKVNVIKADDWQQMTIAEYLKYNTSLGVDSANIYVQNGWSYSLNNANTKTSFWVPTNKAWSEAKQKLSPYYNYAEKVSYLTWNSSNASTTEAIQGYDTDSYVASIILSKGLKTSTPQPILSQQQVLNGEVTVVGNVPFEEPMTKELSANIRSIKARTGTVRTMRDDDGISYMWVEPTGDRIKPEVDVVLPQTLSATYDIYCVLMPEERPNRIIFTLHYSDVDGNLKEQVFLDESEENITAFQEEFNLADNATNRTTIRAFSNDPTKVDTLYVGRFTMPVCYEGLPSEVVPVLKISTPFSVFNRIFLEAFTRDIRLAAVILRPVESENKQ